MQFFRTTGASRSRLANVEIRQDDGLYIACANDVSIQGSNIKFNNVRLQQVGAPTADTDAATKKYVDDNAGGGGGTTQHNLLSNRDTAGQHPISAITDLQTKLDRLALKQNKLTAGANITITGDTISATGGSTGNFVTLDTAQNITGIKTFTNGIKIDGATTITGGATIEGKLTLDDKLTINRGLAITGSTSISGGTLNMGSRKIMDLGAPTLDADAATKKYVDDVISASGGGSTPTNMMTTDTAQTITGVKTFENGIKGPVAINGHTTINGATQFNGAISVRDGMFILDPINMNSKKIINLGTPTADADAATKKYVDDGLNLKANKNQTPVLNSFNTFNETNTFNGSTVFKNFVSMYNNNQIKFLKDPTDGQDAATKSYVDKKIKTYFDVEIEKALKPYKKFIEKLMKEKNYDK